MKSCGAAPLRTAPFLSQISNPLPPCPVLAPVEQVWRVGMACGKLRQNRSRRQIFTAVGGLLGGKVVLDHIEHNFAEILASMNTPFPKHRWNHRAKALQGVVANANRAIPFRQRVCPRLCAVPGPAAYAARPPARRNRPPQGNAGPPPQSSLSLPRSLWVAYQDLCRITAGAGKRVRPITFHRPAHQHQRKYETQHDLFLFRQIFHYYNSFPDSQGEIKPRY